MDLHRIASRIGQVRVSKVSLLDSVRESCPDKIPYDVGGLLGRGGQGEAYEVGDDKVLKVGIAKSQGDAERVVGKLKAIQSLDDSVFVSVFDFGVLCPVEAEGFRTDSGFAYFYLMERLTPLSKDDARRASKVLTELSDIHSSHSGSELSQAMKKFRFVKGRELKQEAKLQNRADGTDDWDETNVDGGITIKAMDLFERMTSAGFKHVDMNSNNIMSARDGSLKLIDVESTAFLS